MKYALIDSSNMFFRGRHVAARGTDTWTKLGLAIHIILSSTQKVVRDFNVDHVVFALDGRSWRKDFYEPYKKNRKEARAALTEAEREEDELFYAAYDDLTSFLNDKTQCSVVKVNNAEADDVIARWIALHPDDEVVIISSDSDFYQLISDKVTIFNGITNEHITLNGVFDDKGNAVIDKKTKEQKTIESPDWLLFEKCMRGDTSDNIFSAFPGVRKKGTKNKVGLIEAFEDRETQGFNWNNLMLQRWVDHDDVEHRVLDDYERNRKLIDLNEQPSDIKQAVDEQIMVTLNAKHPSQIGTHFLKFCGKYELNRISDQAQSYVEWLKKPYTGSHRNVSS